GTGRAGSNDSAVPSWRCVIACAPSCQPGGRSMRILGLFAVSVAGAAGMSGSAAPPVNDGPMLDALDPTRIARSVCGPRAGFAAFDARMMLAAGLAGASDEASAAMPLLPGIGRTDIPLDG